MRHKTVTTKALRKGLQAFVNSRPRFIYQTKCYHCGNFTMCAHVLLTRGRAFRKMCSECLIDAKVKSFTDPKEIKK